MSDHLRMVPFNHFRDDRWCLVRFQANYRSTWGIHETTGLHVGNTGKHPSSITEAVSRLWYIWKRIQEQKIKNLQNFLRWQPTRFHPHLQWIAGECSHKLENIQEILGILLQSYWIGRKIRSSQGRNALFCNGDWMQEYLATSVNTERQWKSKFSNNSQQARAPETPIWKI